MVQRIASKSLVAVLVAAGLLAAAPGATAQGTREGASAEAMVADALVRKPASILATMVGAAAFVVTLPFSALGGNADEAAERLIADPAQDAFQRPLGHFPRFR